MEISKMNDAEKKQRFQGITQQMEDNEKRITEVMQKIQALEHEKDRLYGLKRGLHQKRGIYCTEHAYDGVQFIFGNMSFPCKYCGSTKYEGPLANDFHNSINILPSAKWSGRH